MSDPRQPAQRIIVPTEHAASPCMALSIPPPPAPPTSYHFAGVRVDTAARRLWVDDVERRVQPLVFNLLWLLCEQPHQVVPRDVLFQRLWPDGSFPSDESLSQLVFKLRALLGPHGGSIVTVRHVGIRLDADVRAVTDDASRHPGTVPAPLSDEPPVAAANDAAMPPGAPVAAPTDPVGARAAATSASPAAQGDIRRNIRFGWRMAFALALVGVLALALRTWFASEVDPGYGLTVADLGTWRPASIAGIRDALAADARGDRARAQALMESVHAGDPDTPVAALFLATWWAVAGDPRATAMAEAFRTRLGGRAPAYLHHLSRELFGSTPLGAPSAPAHLDLLLSERPRARRLLLARAHWHLGEVEQAAALADLRAIAIDDLADRTQLTALLDRIALGDAAAVAEIVAGLSAADAPSSAARAHVLGWLELAGGNAGSAASTLAAAADAAAGAGLAEPERRLRLSAAIAAGRAGNFAQVRGQVGRARALALQQQRPNQALQAGLLLLALPDWDAATRAAMADELARLPAMAGAWECLEVRLAFLLTALPGQPCPMVALPSTSSLRGLGQMLDAYADLQAGDLAGARVHHAAAVAEGAEAGLLGPWMWLLAGRVGVATGATGPDLRIYPLLVTQAVLWWPPMGQASGTAAAVGQERSSGAEAAPARAPGTLENGLGGRASPGDAATAAALPSDPQPIDQTEKSAR